MKKYLRPAAIAAALVAGTYGILLIAAAAAPVPSMSTQTSQSSVVADHLKAEATLLAHPGTRRAGEPRSP